MKVSFTLNGNPFTCNVNPTRRLSNVLREHAGLHGTKVGCDAGDCGACTILLDGAPACACLLAAGQASERQVTTIEGLISPGAARLKAAFLRHGAAQCGICTPGMLMAATALLATTPRPAPAQAEDALGGVLCRCTGYRKIIAAICDAWREPEPATPPPAGSATGARISRLDGGPKITGTDVFGADEWKEGGLILRALRSPHPHATFHFGDLEAWRASRPDVVAVFTAADIPGRNCFGAIPDFADQPVLTGNLARFRGEAVALVAFEDNPEASVSLDDFPATWTPLDPILDPDCARASGAEPLHHGRPDNCLIEGLVRCGNAERAIEASAHVAEGSIETGFVEHAYIEPEAGAAWFDGETLVIRACTQAPYMDRDGTAQVLGLAQDKVRIIPAATGGGFGSKIDLSVQPLLGLATLKTGRPSRMVYSRSESMTSTTKRHPSRISARIGCDTAGRITAMEFDGVFNTGAYASWGPTVAARVPVHATGPYRTANVQARARAIHTHGPVSGAFRGFGVPQAAIMQETLYDRLAGVAGIDRLAFRILNAFREGDRSATGQKLQATGITDCLNALRERWPAALAEADAFNATSKTIRRGAGIASCWYGCGNTGIPNPSTMRIGLRSDGTLILHQGAADMGQGANTVITQIAADALGLPVGAFTLAGGDTSLSPDAGKSSASRQTFISGRAAQAAALALRSAILRHANLDGQSTLAINGATLTVTGEGSREINLADLPADESGYVFVAQERYDPPVEPLGENGQGAPYAVYGYGAQLVELEVDRALGTIRLLQVTAAHDVGRAINPTLAEGQIEGGIAQGIGMALMEDYIPGRTENLHDYLIPTVGDVPEITSILIEQPDPEGPFGAKGLGEHVLIPTAPAILNAIRHATGAEVTRLPALPHRVRAAILAAERTS